MFRNMKKIVLTVTTVMFACYAVALCLGLYISHYSMPNIKPHYVPVNQHESYSVMEIDTLTIGHSIADIEIVQGKGDSVECVLTGEVSPNLLPLYTLRSDLLNKVLTIGTNRFEERGFSLPNLLKGDLRIYQSLKLEIRIPAGFNRTLCLKNNIDTKIGTLTVGQFIIDGKHGDVEADTILADRVVVTSNSGDFKVGYLGTSYFKDSTDRGYVTIKDLMVERADVFTSSGDITIEKVGTVNKPQVAKSIKADSSILNVETTSGDIAVRGIGKGSKFKTTSGDIRVTLGVVDNFSLSATTGTGMITNEQYPMVVEEKGEKIFRGYQGKPAIRVSMNTTTGNIRIMK